jgi:hypothetical protein
MHMADCPVMTEPHTITRELAERGPFLHVDTFGDGMGDACADCLASDSDLNVPANHGPSCLWRRAKALSPEAAR